MRWFKHISTSQNDEILSELMDEFGAEGYGVWWLILEKIAQLMDESSRCFARFSLKVWASSARISPKKFQSVVNFLEKKERFLLKFEGNLLTIECTKLLKYRDEWTERQAAKAKKTQDKLPSKSGETPSLTRAHSDTDTDTDIELDTDTESEKKRRVFFSDEKKMSADDKPPNVENGSKKNRSENFDCSFFDQFWGIYPRHENRKKSLEVWKRKNLNKHAEIILLDVENRKAVHAPWRNGYIPHATTYLNGERWHDEIQTKNFTPQTLFEKNQATMEIWLNQSSTIDGEIANE